MPSPLPPLADGRLSECGWGFKTPSRVRSHEPTVSGGLCRWDLNPAHDLAASGHGSCTAKGRRSCMTAFGAYTIERWHQRMSLVSLDLKVAKLFDENDNKHVAATNSTCLYSPASRDSRLLADRWLSGCGWASRPQQSSIARANRLGGPVSRDLDPAVSARLMPSRFVAGSCQLDVRVWMSGLAQLLMLKSLEPYIIGMSKGWPRLVPTRTTRRRRHGHSPGESDRGELYPPARIATAACPT